MPIKRRDEHNQLELVMAVKRAKAVGRPVTPTTNDVLRAVHRAELLGTKALTPLELVSILRVWEATTRYVPTEVRAHNRIRGRLSAIRAFCTECCMGNTRSIRKCLVATCPLWSFRMGTNGMRPKRTIKALPNGFQRRPLTK